MTVDAKVVHDNPSPEDLRRFTEEMPQARLTEFSSVNVQTRVVSRSAGSTCVCSSLTICSRCSSRRR